MLSSKLPALLQITHRAENRAVYMMLNTTDGKVFSSVLDKLDGKILKKDKTGTVDPFAMAYAAGQHDLIKLIKDMSNDGSMAR